ncbi:chaplin [Kitasatospora sp. A2-31]|uniref:chaplin n=1 Tax=Kitasatospora sp. A2-31 TaxID=2916414 RepID=UPI001EECBE29|nr:chaplin [Kitasatospora sp. A2-31]MCG6497940.1 chaplin [Kitasatospora sp. A2-31]
MTNTRKYLIAAGFSAALAVLSAGPAFAADLDTSRYSSPRAADPLASDAAAMAAALLDGSGAGTVCINTGSATASGIVAGSPGVLSGNQIQIPINLQLNVCGNSISLLGG